MKKIPILLLLLMFIGACHSVLSPIEKRMASVDKSGDSLAVSCIYNDSIDSIILFHSAVRVYQTMSLVRDSIEASLKDSLFNFPIDTVWGELSDREAMILDFVISDINLYKSDYAPIRQPFNPTFALEFVKEKQKAYYMVSFGTGEVAIADSIGNLKFFLLKDIRQIERWYDLLLDTKK